MNATLKATSAAGITRKLQSLGYEKFHGEAMVGFGVHTDFRGVVCLITRGYRDSNIDQDLRDAGYLIEDVNRWVDFNGIHVVACTVVGRMVA